jgi:hypothetical protein
MRRLWIYIEGCTLACYVCMEAFISCDVMYECGALMYVHITYKCVYTPVCMCIIVRAQGMFTWDWRQIFVLDWIRRALCMHAIHVYVTNEAVYRRLYMYSHMHVCVQPYVKTWSKTSRCARVSSVETQHQCNRRLKLLALKPQQTAVSCIIYFCSCFCQIYWNWMNEQVRLLWAVMVLHAE